MQEEIRCQNCNWHLADVDYADSIDNNFFVKKICPRCKTRNVFKIKKDKSAPASQLG